MRLGLISDVHGNAAALKAALDALADVEMIVCLGDSINQFRFSNEVVGLLRTRNVRTIQGNHEQIFFSPQGEAARKAPWISHGELEWLSCRPTYERFDIAGKRILAVHATSWESAYEYVPPDSPNFVRFAEAGADVLIYGHTHMPVVRRVGDTLIINPGSLGEGRPDTSGFVCSYALLDVITEKVSLVDLV